MHQSELIDSSSGRGPLSTFRASLIILWRRWSCDEMKIAEDRSPVQRVISTQSRDWFRRVRSCVKGSRMRGDSVLRTSCVGGMALGRSWRVCGN